jgi:transcription termination/antitermination protein NusG
MTVSDEQPIEGDTHIPAEMPVNDTSKEVVAATEPVMKTAAKPADVKPEVKKRTLASGREATTLAGGPTLENFGGVATHRIVNEAPDRPEAQSVDSESAEGEFDPAADMPMYRPGFDWFVLRVASNKESGVRETLLRKVQIEGMEHLVGRIMVPTEKTQSIKGGVSRVSETKLYPGYVFVEMSLETDGRIPQDVFFLIKETTGVGDFVGTAGRPTPMAGHEVEKMLFDSRKPDEAPQVKMEFQPGDPVTIKEGPFENYEGTVDEVMPDKGLVRVLVTIFGRQAPVELEYWQIAKAEE